MSRSDFSMAKTVSAFHDLIGTNHFILMHLWM